MNMKKCIICNTNEQVENYSVIQGYKYLICRNCGFIFLEQPASNEELLSSYLGGTLKRLRRRLLTRFRHFQHFRHFNQHMERTKKVSDLVGQYYPEGRINFLDIGCNKGFLLANALKRNWNIFGVEFVFEMIAPFKRDHNEYSDQIYIGSFEDVQDNFSDNFFDAITAIDVIEHVKHPDNDLRNIFRILKPGGICVIQTPDSGSDESIKHGPTWGALRPMEHLLVFNQSNLEKLVKSIGFSEFKIIPNFTYENGNLSAVLVK